ncbi:MAG TPA: hypothetical protein VME66_13770 [Candidatus Acidoferrales bacterium]|nr:hypothetical protein [Candidatus Acidoferrales bacterium]
MKLAFQTAVGDSRTHERGGSGQANRADALEKSVQRGDPSQAYIADRDNAANVDDDDLGVTRLSQYGVELGQALVAVIASQP